jgi:peroxiredoxin
MNYRWLKTMLLLFFALAGLLDKASAQASGFPYALKDAAGALHREREWEQAKAAVYFFIGVECPISNRYAPEIQRIVAAYKDRGIAFFGVQSDPELKPETAQKHATEFGLPFPVLLDPEQTLAARFGVALTPTVVVVKPGGQVLYRGRIDNRYLDFGRYRNVGIKPDLRNALDAFLEGKAIAEPVTKSIGCGLPPLKKASASHHHHHHH